MRRWLIKPQLFLSYNVGITQIHMTPSSSASDYVCSPCSTFTPPVLQIADVTPRRI